MRRKLFADVSWERTLQFLRAEMLNKQIPNLQSLVYGVLLTIGFDLHLIVNHEYPFMVMFFTSLIGLPFAFLFLMFNKPKDSGKVEFGTVLAMPFCALMWPILILALIAARPWKEKRWRDRNVPTNSNPIVDDQKETNSN